MATCDPGNRRRLRLIEDLTGPAAAGGGRLPVRLLCSLAVCLISGGCADSPQQQLLGTWLGRPASAATEKVDKETSAVTLEFELQFLDAHQFAMTLRGPQGRVDRRSGRYRVVRVYGPRYDIELMTADPPDRVALELVFEGPDRMAVHEVNGDSRLDDFSFERLPAVRRSGDAAPATQGSL